MADDIKRELTEDEKAVKGAIQISMYNSALRFADGENLSNIIKNIALDLSELNGQSDIIRPDAEFSLPLLDSASKSAGSADINFTCRADGTVDVYLNESGSALPTLYGRVQPNSRGGHDFNEAPTKSSDNLPISQRIDKDYYSFGDRNISDYRNAILDGISKFMMPNDDPAYFNQTSFASMNGHDIDLATITIPGGIINPAVQLDIKLEQTPDHDPAALEAFSNDVEAIYMNANMRHREVERRIESISLKLDEETDPSKRRQLEEQLSSDIQYRDNIPNMVGNQLMQLAEQEKHASIYTRELTIYEDGAIGSMGSIKVKINPFMTPDGNRQNIAKAIDEAFADKDKTLIKMLTLGNSLDAKGRDELIFCPPVNTREVLNGYIKDNANKAAIISDGIKDIPVTISYDKKKDSFVFKNGLKKLNLTEHQVAKQIAATKTVRIYKSSGKTDRQSFNLRELGKKIASATVGKLIKTIEDLKQDKASRQLLMPEVLESRKNLADAIYQGTAMIEAAVNKNIRENKDLNKAYATQLADMAFKEAYGATYKDASHQYTISKNDLTEKINAIKQDPSDKAKSQRAELEKQYADLVEMSDKADAFYKEQYDKQAKIYGVEELSVSSSNDIRTMTYGLNFEERAAKVARFLQSNEGKGMLTNVYLSLIKTAAQQKAYVPLVIKENNDKGLKHEIYFSKDRNKTPIIMTYEQSGTDKYGLPLYKKISEPELLSADMFAEIAMQGLMETPMIAAEKSYTMYGQNMDKHIAEELSYKVTGAPAKDGRKIENIIDEANKKASHGGNASRNIKSNEERT